MVFSICTCARHVVRAWRAWSSCRQQGHPLLQLNSSGGNSDQQCGPRVSTRYGTRGADVSSSVRLP